MKAQVRQFLVGFKEAAIIGGIQLVPRNDSKETLLFLGYDKKNLEKELLELSVENYSKGPLEDHSGSGELWEFGLNIDSYEIYIKLKTYEVNNVKRAKCVSFHIAKFPMRYPFQ